MSTPTEYELSPSKARLAATTSLAWTRITAWLIMLFSPATATATTTTTTTTTFEQNPATLAYLQQLMQANLAADQIAGLRRDVERQQLAVYEESQSPNQQQQQRQQSTIITSALLTDCLSAEAREALDSMAHARVLLSLSSPLASAAEHSPADGGEADCVGHMARSIHRLTRHVFGLENGVRDEAAALSGAEQALAAASSATQRRRGEAGHDDELEHLRLRTAQWARETRQIALKTDEYDRRIAALLRHVRDQSRDQDVCDYEDDDDDDARAGSSTPAGGNAGPAGHEIETITQTQTRIEAKRKEVRALEQRLSAFHGLPPDVDASRDELRRAQRQLEHCKAQREQLFERIM